MRALTVIAAVIAIVWAQPALAQVLDRPIPSAIDVAPDSHIRQLFDKVAAQFVEVGGASPQDRSHQGRESAVATKAKPAGYPGLCEATVAQTGFAGTDIAGVDPLETHKAFKVVGSLAPLPNLWSKEYEADLAVKCAHAGRVLRVADGPFDQEMFFVDATPPEVGSWFAARALEIALQQVREGAIRPNCGSPSAKDDGCHKALSDNGTLRLQRLVKVDARPCKDAVSNCYHVTGLFLDSAGEIGGEDWLLDLDATMNVPRRNDRDVGAVTNVKLGKSSWIF